MGEYRSMFIWKDEVNAEDLDLYFEILFRIGNLDFAVGSDYDFYNGWSNMQIMKKGRY